MKPLKLLFLYITTSVMISSCVVQNEVIDHIDYTENTPFSLNQYVSSYDLWYVDYNSTIGTNEIPFLSKAFTVSFLNGNIYANNNIVDIGKTGNGLGVLVGNYQANGSVLQTNHTLDNQHDFEVIQLSENEIRIDDLHQNISYFLTGYQRDNFDYDKLFYENIEYLLQEYVAWEKIDENGGYENPFDTENFLQFTPENDVTFYSSHDFLGTNIDFIKWDYIGSYEIATIKGYNDLLLLTLNYNTNAIDSVEKFELKIINDQTISLYHISSKTTYTFLGKGFIQHLRSSTKNTVNTAKNSVRKNSRKRTKIQRKIVDKQN
ncbi:hypothetical protein [Tenacibaculum finnmarkense]|uniref:Nicotinic acid mononucleotide adenyltransferase n=1 Tax=Tenacibaculum finnmarkense genomovar finnmarkense TaxID=1458503 RepID=A0AAP1RCV5_9FLAO|nr:hypothetical protein [Tenacibaculum finnmarkense]MBE7651691.1 hypothetical protein [Tenacibaculum finnmarkense genomovar finnmarkense]MBE7693959.1 hypothetical protein [Tenacibaculum finnmarkense genomovar finnmarkense]MCD8426471.1 hypothetical protein [Tenacibaculum finnmarkense genomovar finnmarkense]MCG8730262.1 hypothetical protein [Tenacibaculum finnmarkense]MCG8750692.1 hypothetical protein [Tenacibaculum finnmarkense]